MNKPDWTQATANFMQQLRNHRMLSTHTCRHYQRDIESFAAFCSKRAITSPSDAHQADVRQWAAELHHRGLAASSIQRGLSALRGFYRHLANNHNPADGVQAPKKKQRLPKALDVDKMDKLLRIEGNDFLVVRDRAMLELMYSSGLRLAEIVSVPLDQLELQEKLVTVTGKGGKTRRLPVGNKACQALQQWLRLRQDIHSDCAEVFISQRGTALTPRAVQKRLQKYSHLQDMEQAVSPHMLRHSFASHVLQSSGDLRAVQELLGHANISTTQIYTHLDYQHLAKVYDQTHPRAGRKKQKET